MTATSYAPGSAGPDQLVDLGTLRAEVSTATRLVTPVWPVASFVAANPMRGLEHLPFDEACRAAQRWFGARTHCPLGWYRELHAEGRITLADLRAAIIEVDPVSALSPMLVLGDRLVDPVDVLVTDLLQGPELRDDRTDEPADPWAASAVEHLGSWAAAHLGEHTSLADADDRAAGMFAFWRRNATADPRLARLVGRSGRRWIGRLPDDPTEALALAFAHLGVDDRVDALRALATRAPGWCGLAVWMEEWADPARPGPRLRPVDIVAVLAVLDAAAGTRSLSLPPAAPPDERSIVAERVDAVLRVLGVEAASAESQRRLTDLVRHATPRTALWLRAHEIHYRDELLGTLSTRHRTDTPPTEVTTGTTGEQPDAQLIACIDVRSERLRRRLEAAGRYETFGFAGFFGVPIRWRPAGSDTTEARCPVLVTPRHEVTERHLDDGAEHRRGRVRQGRRTAWDSAKHDLGAPFALAESAGWWSGAVAAARTIAPDLVARRATSSPAEVVLDDAHHGLSLDEQILFAEAILTTIGLRRPAPLVLLCGHASTNANNAHASSLHCGACGGAPGGANARVAAAVLNHPEVRAGLAARGLDVPDATWFVAAEHDTTTDTVRVLDRHLIPTEHTARLETVERDLRVAGGEAAAERVGRLPGGRVERRAHDWAQTRPEWGLARNAAFVIGPRSATTDVDLDGRVFLHSYDPDGDPDGVALETIMTAPLVVAQWISAQYYASSVDPEVFGAGDKLVHNPVEGFGVWRGQGGDLAVGLPWQSVGVGGELEHEPLRLLAVVHAPIDRIEAIVQRNAGLRQLLDNSWIHLVARDGLDDPWSVRSPSGTWTTWHDADDWNGRWSTPTADRPVRQEA